MTLGIREVAAAAAFATILILAACGGGDGGGETMRLTLTDDGCTYEGDATPASGQLTMDVENQTSLVGAFALARIREGSTADDVRAYIDEEQQRWDTRMKLAGPPPFYEQVVRVGVDGGASSKLPALLIPGSYVLTCFVDDLPTWRAYVASSLDVAG